MCGRYSLFAPAADIAERFGATFARAFEPRYNMAPGQDLPVVRNDDPETIRFDHWGLLPPWAESESEGLINARAETLSEKRSFADSFRKRRCLVLADGFYEWGEAADGKQPYRITRADESPFAMAGLWTRFRPTVSQTDLSAFGEGADADDPDLVETFCILTCDANETVGEIHDRMPVILDRETERAWLSADGSAADLLVPAPDASLSIYPVSRSVNDPSNDRPSVVEAVDVPG